MADNNHPDKTSCTIFVTIYSTLLQIIYMCRNNNHVMVLSPYPLPSNARCWCTTAYSIRPQSRPHSCLLAVGFDASSNIVNCKRKNTSICICLFLSLCIVHYLCESKFFIQSCQVPRHQVWVRQYFWNVDKSQWHFSILSLHRFFPWHLYELIANFP